MTQVLQRLATMLRNEDRMRSAIRGALAYPTVLLIIAIAVLFAVVFFVLPQFSQVFELIGVHFEEDGERQLKDLVKLLEPAVIVVMGALVGFIVASVMLPLFDFSSASGCR